MLQKLIIPPPELPKPISGYKLNSNPEDMLNWDFVSEEMAFARYYWVSTVGVGLHPHAVPVWGIWYENRVHLEGSPKTAWAANLIRTPSVAIHLPSGERVVMIEGQAQFLQDEDLDPTMWHTIDTLYREKYNVQTGSPWIVIHPTKVLAWDDPNLQKMTRWSFE